MRYAKFKAKVCNTDPTKGRGERVAFINTNPDNKMVIKLKELKRQTGNIKYNCDFDINGKCKDTRSKQRFRSIDYPYSPSNKCCCVLCYRNKGYLDGIYSEKDLRYYAKLFNPLSGFWRKDKGCVLDRSMRSHICISYNCFYLDFVHPNKSKKVRELYKLCDKIKKLEESLTK